MLLKVSLDDKSSMLLELPQIRPSVESSGGEIVPTGVMRNALSKAEETVKEMSQAALNSAVSSLASFSRLIVNELSNSLSDVRPFDVSVEFGIQFTGDLEVKVVSASALASVKVTIKCQRS